MHALLYIGTPEEMLRQLPEDEQKSDTDVLHMFVEQFDLKSAHALSRAASLRPVVRSHRTFVLAFQRATHEAQNALLKTLEDPAPTSRFCIIVPREDVLIATVRSRLLSPERLPVRAEISVEGQTFLDASYGERIARIAEKVKTGDDAWYEEVLRAIEVVAHQSKDAALLREIVFVREHVSSPGASKKMLMEHLALSLPQ